MEGVGFILAWIASHHQNYLLMRPLEIHLFIRPFDHIEIYEDLSLPAWIASHHIFQNIYFIRFAERGQPFDQQPFTVTQVK